MFVCLFVFRACLYVSAPLSVLLVVVFLAMYVCLNGRMHRHTHTRANACLCVSVCVCVCTSFCDDVFISTSSEGTQSCDCGVHVPIVAEQHVIGRGVHYTRFSLSAHAQVEERI